MRLAAWLERHHIFYGWIVVFVCFVVICLVFGIRLSFGLFFDTLTRSGDFDWTRADTAAAFSIAMIVFAVTSTSIGWAQDRWGARRVFSVGLLVMASGLVLTSRMTSLLQFYLFYGLWTGFGITVLGLSMQAAVVSRWFDRLGRRGLAIGLAFSGTGIGILLLAPVVERTISQVGWRAAYVLLAALLAGICLPLVLLLLRDRPQDLGLLPDGIQRRSASYSDRLPGTRPAKGLGTSLADEGDDSVAWTFGRALGSPNFWLLMVSGTMSLFTLRMITVHQVSHLIDSGIPRSTAAAILGSTGLVTALSFIVFGSLSDRIGRSRSFYIGGVAQVLALLLLISVNEETSQALLLLYALLWGIGEGSRSGLLTAIAGDLFSGPAMGTIVGTLGGFFGFGAAMGSWLGGYLYDVNGSYTMAFFVALSATVVASLAIAVVQWRSRHNSFHRV